MSRMNRRSFRPAAARMLAAGVLAAGLAVPATASAGVLDSVSGWWPMYEGSGQTVHDLSGKGNNGTLGSTAGRRRQRSDLDQGLPVRLRAALRRQRLRPDPGLAGAELATSSRSRPGSAAARSPGTNRYIVGKGATGCDSSSYGLYTAYNGGLRFYVTDTDGALRSPRAPSTRARSGTASGTTSPARLTAPPPSCSSTASSSRARPAPARPSTTTRRRPATLGSAASSAPATCSTRATSTTWRSSARRCRSTSTGRRCRSCSPSRCGRSTPRPWRRLRRRHPTGREPSGAVRRASFTPDRSCLGDRGPGRGRASPARGRDEALKRRRWRPEPVRQISAARLIER